MLLCSHVCSCVRGYTFMHDSSASECGCACMALRKLLSDVTQTDAYLLSLSGFSGVHGNLFVNTSPPQCKNKSIAMLYCV